MHTPDGYHETKYSGSFLERRLGLVSTTRNWNTVPEAVRAGRALRTHPRIEAVSADVERRWIRRGQAQERGARRPTLNASVRKRRADRAFYIRLAGAIRQNERALERLKR